MEEKNIDDRFSRSQNILRNLRIIFKTVQQHSRKIEKECGLSGAMLWMLWELFSTPGMKVSALADSLSIHVSTCSNMLDKLQDRGLVRRERKDTDQRAVRVYLTDSGKKLLATAPRPAQGTLSAALDKLPELHLQNLAISLEELLKVMQEADEEASFVPLTEKGDEF